MSKHIFFGMPFDFSRWRQRLLNNYLKEYKIEASPTRPEPRKDFEAWFEAEAMPLEADWFKRDTENPEEYDSVIVQASWRAWQAALGKS